MAESSAVTAAVPAPTKLEELLEITAQSLVRAEVAEHYEVVRELGRGKYGHVMLVTHRQRGKELSVPCQLLCLVSSTLTRAQGMAWAGGTSGPGIRHGRENSEGDQMDGDLPSQEPFRYTRDQVMPRGSPEYLARL